MSTVSRQTRETRVRIALGDLRGGGAPRIETDDEFLTHMLTTLSRYAGWAVEVEATGDLRHHLIEDVAITLGAVAGRDTPATCVRYGEATVPMDEALVQVALDAGGRPHYEGELPSTLYDHFFRSFALNADWTVHVRVIRGRDKHHIVEAAFKALGLAIRQAVADDGAVFSTKGAVSMTWTADLDEAAELDEGAQPRGGAELEGGAKSDRAAEPDETSESDPARAANTEGT